MDTLGKGYRPPFLLRQFYSDNKNYDMRQLITICSLVLLTACTATKKSTSMEPTLNGNWIPVKQEMGGKDLPAAYYQSQRLEIRDTAYTATAESVDKGKLQYKDGLMDIYGKEGVNSGKHFKARYKLEQGQLFIVYDLTGKDYPATFETASRPGLFMSVYKKE